MSFCIQILTKNNRLKNLCVKLNAFQEEIAIFFIQKEALRGESVNFKLDLSVTSPHQDINYLTTFNN